MGKKEKPPPLELPEPSATIRATGHARKVHRLPQPDRNLTAILNKKPLIVALAQALGDIEIDRNYRRKLKKARVRSLWSLFLYAYNRKGRKKLSRDTGIDESLLVNWIGQADIFRIDGIGRTYASLLVAAGVDSPVELARRSPEELHKILVTTNRREKIVHRLPTQAQVQKWIREAKALRRIVEY
jgi:predicted flap endonuclease-1-like 5' DNA nuclease